MRPTAAWLATAAVLVCAVAVAGCGLGPGASSAGTATLTVTRDYGSQNMVEATAQDPPASETVIRLLDDEADITTRYGGGFVQSIDGVSGGGGSDWFFYVNGIESPVGAAEVHVKGGDRIWWDYRDWSGAMSVPAVVGSWPEPFSQASSANPAPVGLTCFDVQSACATVKESLADAGIHARAQRGGSGPHILVGRWYQVGRDPAVGHLYGGPAKTGVFALFKGRARGPFDLVAFDPGGKPVEDLGSGAGLVAAVARSGEPPTWIVTGSSPSAVGRAADALDSDSLRNRYAVAATPQRTVPLPIVGKGGAG